MTRPIIQSVSFPATAKQLFKLYMNPKLHAAFTGAPVKISPKPNSPFTAFGRMLSGTTLLTIPGKLIVTFIVCVRQQFCRLLRASTVTRSHLVAGDGCFEVVFFL